MQANQRIARAIIGTHTFFLFFLHLHGYSVFAGALPPLNFRALIASSVKASFFSFVASRFAFILILSVCIANFFAYRLALILGLSSFFPKSALMMAAIFTRS
jgi:hypothetical protein